MKRTVTVSILVAWFINCTGCIVVTRTDGAGDKEKELTAGLAQKQIRTGMSQAEVAQALGSPNIVTRDSDGKEVWIYDKIATEASYSKDSSGTSLMLVLFMIGSSKSTEKSSITQRTLTVLIKYDKDGKVDSTSFHASKF